MGIDLEQPSGEYYKEENRPNVNVNMVNGDDEGCNRGGVIVNSSNISRNNKENTGPNSVMESTSPSTQGPHDYEDVNQGNSTSKTNKKNSVPKKRQVHTDTELVTIGMHDSWQQMGHSSLRAPALDCSYETQERMQGTEQLNSRAPTLDGYFGAQQIVQGMGQLNSMAPSRDDYYGNQHNMQGLGQLNSIAPMHDAHYITQQRMHGMGQLHFRPQTVPNCFDIQDGLQDMDQSNVGPSELHGIPTKHLHPKHLSR
ncbi:hypothetical protein JRO89_XS06G0238000 [Xanthoceras sorbifolium]|uniref:Uncharacterized protein n=1 Tax=Xanthoceras sorbifolium TaxID=99658 RepID=A0ABQ8HZ85_9ROSI|nr:hypothetical protein JRO89_XS06G0238000 [Xanthoceras sorbifolium]